jgi:transmembrane sensor
MNKQSLPLFLENYFTGKLSPKEEKLLFDYLSDPINKDEVQKVMATDWEEGNFEVEMTDQVANAVFHNIVEHQPPLKISMRTRYLTAAAAILVAMFSMTYLWQQSATPQAQLPGLVKKIIREEHEKIVLPDGSEVILNANTTITYPEKFSPTKREVTLEGEGYFDIKHDAGKPFIVHSGKISTRVLGTAFNIRASAEENQIFVTVTRGKVSVSKGNQILGTLLPGEQIQYDIAYNKPALKKVNAEKVISWQARDLFFNDATLAEIIDVLAKRFNTKISFADSSGQKCKLTATFLKGESLEEILKVIAQFNGLTYKINDTGIIINAKACER